MRPATNRALLAILLVLACGAGLIAASKANVEVKPHQNAAPSSGSAAQTWAAYVLDFGRDTARSAISEAIAFAALGFVVGWLFKRELIHSIGVGLRSVGTEISQTFIDHVVPEVRKGREAIETALTPVLEPPETPAPPQIEQKLKEIRQEISKGESGSFERAERELRALRAEHQDNWEILQSLVWLYLDPRYNQPESAIDVLSKAEATFRDKASFHFAKAVTYMKLKGRAPLAFKHAVDAIRESIRLEPNEPSWRRDLGYAYFWFDDVDRAISETESALEEMLKKQPDAKAKIVLCKNNLAYYYALTVAPEKRDVALAYAREVYNGDKDDPAKMDTLGYVLLKYGQTKAEIQEAIKLFGLAQEKNPRSPFPEHSAEAYRKLQTVPG